MHWSLGIFRFFPRRGLKSSVQVCATGATRGGRPMNFPFPFGKTKKVPLSQISRFSIIHVAGFKTG
jgi:hypothetical protein